MGKATTTRKVDYFRLPRPLWRKVKKCLAQEKEEEDEASAAGKGFRAACRQRHQARALKWLTVEGHPPELGFPRSSISW